MVDEQTYFTYIPLETEGFTSQLALFQLLLRLGDSLQFAYLHTPFCAPRSSSTIYDQLGINAHFKNRVPEDFETQFTVVPLTINQILGELAEDIPLGKLQHGLRQHIVHKLSQLRRSRHLPLLIAFSIRRPSEPTKSSWVERLTFRGAWRLQRLVHQYRNRRLPLSVGQTLNRLHSLAARSGDLLPPVPVDFYRIYQVQRQQMPIDTLFEMGKVKLLVHIRQGDTAVIETPWHTYLPVLWRRSHVGQLGYNETAKLTSVNRRLIHPTIYYEFLKEFIAMWPADALTTVISSDGYARGFAQLFAHWDWYDFSAEQQTQLKQIQSTYNERAFAPFETLPHTTTVVGETDANLLSLIDCALNADLIIVGTHQRMLSKLLAIYPRIENPPLLILIHFGLDEALLKSSNYVLTDIPHLYFDLEKDKISDLIQHAKTFCNR